MASLDIEKNSIATAPSEPEKDGYIFAGWYKDINLKNEYDFTSKVTGSMTLYAAWDKIKGAEDKIILTIGEKEANVFGELKENDVAPIAVNNRTMLPARFVAENLGAKVIWNEKESEKIVIVKDDIEIIIILGAEIATVNGEEITLDSPAFTDNDRTYTPVRFICESLGAEVEWNSDTNTVTITR